MDAPKRLADRLPRPRNRQDHHGRAGDRDDPHGHAKSGSGAQRGRVPQKRATRVGGHLQSVDDLRRADRRRRKALRHHGGGARHRQGDRDDARRPEGRVVLLHGLVRGLRGQEEGRPIHARPQKAGRPDAAGAPALQAYGGRAERLFLRARRRVAPFLRPQQPRGAPSGQAVPKRGVHIRAHRDAGEFRAEAGGAPRQDAQRAAELDARCAPLHDCDIDAEEAETTVAPPRARHRAPIDWFGDDQPGNDQAVPPAARRPRAGGAHRAAAKGAHHRLL